MASSREDAERKRIKAAIAKVVSTIAEINEQNDRVSLIAWQRKINALLVEFKRSVPGIRLRDYYAEIRAGISNIICVPRKTIEAIVIAEQHSHRKKEGIDDASIEYIISTIKGAREKEIQRIAAEEDAAIREKEANIIQAMQQAIPEIADLNDIEQIERWHTKIKKLLNTAHEEHLYIEAGSPISQQILRSIGRVTYQRTPITKTISQASGYASWNIVSVINAIKTEKIVTLTTQKKALIIAAIKDVINKYDINGLDEWQENIANLIKGTERMDILAALKTDIAESPCFPGVRNTVIQIVENFASAEVDINAIVEQIYSKKRESIESIIERNQKFINTLIEAIQEVVGIETASSIIELQAWYGKIEKLLRTLPEDDASLIEFNIKSQLASVRLETSTISEVIPTFWRDNINTIILKLREHAARNIAEKTARSITTAFSEAINAHTYIELAAAKQHYDIAHPPMVDILQQSSLVMTEAREGFAAGLWRYVEDDRHNFQVSSDPSITASAMYADPLAKAIYRVCLDGVTHIVDTEYSTALAELRVAHQAYQDQRSAVHDNPILFKNMFDALLKFKGLQVVLTVEQQQEIANRIVGLLRGFRNLVDDAERDKGYIAELTEKQLQLQKAVAQEVGWMSETERQKIFTFVEDFEVVASEIRQKFIAEPAATSNVLRDSILPISNLWNARVKNFDQLITKIGNYKATIRAQTAGLAIVDAFKQVNSLQQEDQCLEAIRVYKTNHHLHANQVMTTNDTLRNAMFTILEQNLCFPSYVVRNLEFLQQQFIQLIKTKLHI
jgi:hypothetical protein